MTKIQKNHLRANSWFIKKLGGKDYLIWYTYDIGLHALLIAPKLFFPRIIILKFIVLGQLFQIKDNKILSQSYEVTMLSTTWFLTVSGIIIQSLLSIGQLNGKKAIIKTNVKIWRNPIRQQTDEVQNLYV